MQFDPKGTDYTLTCVERLRETRPFCTRVAALRATLAANAVHEGTGWRFHYLGPAPSGPWLVTACKGTARRFVVDVQLRPHARAG